jgi:hypothetical protein
LVGQYLGVVRVAYEVVCELDDYLCHSGCGCCGSVDQWSRSQEVEGKYWPEPCWVGNEQKWTSSITRLAPFEHSHEVASHWGPGIFCSLQQTCMETSVIGIALELKIGTRIWRHRVCSTRRRRFHGFIPASRS